GDGWTADAGKPGRSGRNETGGVALLSDQDGVGPVAADLRRLRAERAQAERVQAAHVELRLDHGGGFHQPAVVEQAAVAPDLEAQAAGGAAAVVDAEVGAQQAPAAVELQVEAAVRADAEAAAELQ